MKHKIVFAISLAGILAGIATAIFFSVKSPALPPAFSPASNPYASAIYAEGIVESAQTSGENINMYPEVAGTVKEILVSEGQHVKAGDPLLRLDESIQGAAKERDARSGGVSGGCRGSRAAHCHGHFTEDQGCLRRGSPLGEQRCVGRRNECRGSCERKS